MVKQIVRKKMPEQEKKQEPIVETLPQTKVESVDTFAETYLKPDFSYLLDYTSSLQEKEPYFSEKSELHELSEFSENDLYIKKIKNYSEYISSLSEKKNNIQD